MTVREKGKKFQANIMLDGKRWRPSFPTYQMAVDWETAVKEAFNLGRSIPNPEVFLKKHLGLVTIQDALEAAWVQRWSTQKDGVRTKAMAQEFVAFVGAHTKLINIQKSDLKAYTAYLLEELENSGPRINRKMSAVGVMLDIAEEEEVIDVRPRLKRFKESSPREDFLDFGEEDPILSTMLAEGYEELHDFTLFLLDTGARYNEGRRFYYRDFDRGDKSVRFPDRKSGHLSVVYLTSRAEEALDRQRRRGHMDQPFGKLLHKESYRKMKRILNMLDGRYAQINMPFHILRHSCASRLARRGKDAKRIQEWMDHSNIQTTMRYMKLRPDDLLELRDALEVPGYNQKRGIDR